MKTIQHDIQFWGLFMGQRNFFGTPDDERSTDVSSYHKKKCFAICLTSYPNLNLLSGQMEYLRGTKTFIGTPNTSRRIALVV